MTGSLTCLLGPHASELVQLDAPVLAALVHLDPAGPHVGVLLVLLCVQGHLVGAGLPGLQGGVDLVSSLPPGLAVSQHGGSLLQAVGGAVPCLALALGTNNPAVQGPENRMDTILVMIVQILVHCQLLQLSLTSQSFECNTYF